MGSLKQVQETARLAQNTTNSNAQTAYGQDYQQNEDDIIALEAADALATGAHVATAISVDSTNLDGVAINVQTVLEELETQIQAAAATTDTFQPKYSTLTAASANIQDNTLTATGLSVTFPIVGTYSVEAFLLYTTPAAQDIQFKFNTSGTVTGAVGTSDLWIINKPTGDATAGLAIPLLLPTSWTTAVSILTTGAPADDNPVIIRGKLVVTVAGTLTIQFAQVTTGAFNTHVGAGSWLKIQRVA